MAIRTPRENQGSSSPRSGSNPPKNPVQGGCDMGAIHSVFSGCLKVADDEVKRE